jgi:hypothetical protein
MKGVNRRIVYAFLFMILLTMLTNLNYLFSGKIVSKSVPEEEVKLPIKSKTSIVDDKKVVDKLPNKSKTTVVADIKMVDKLPAGIVKKETYIGYSYI